jgi:pimeloyl-ACP methyl ester carboxylesterase
VGWHRVVGLPLVAALLLTSCSGSSEPSASTTSAPPEPTTSPSTTAATTTTTVVLPPATPVEWSGCGGGLDCATVSVPVSYQDPSLGSLSLALVRRPAGDPGQRIGTLLVNPGGPGASGVKRVRRGFSVSAEVASRFDIVGFDPRGVGDSTPTTCGDTVGAFRRSDLDPDTTAEREQLAAAARAVADECTETEGARLAHLGTWEVSHDVEVIRRALGEQTVSFVGLSYGTLVGLLWAEAYPSSVRALVLDGVVDPAAGGDTSSLAQVKAIDASLSEIDAACAADAACPVTPAGGVLAAYDELARRLETGTVSDPDVGPTQLAYAAFSATYGPDRWPELWRALAEGLDGDLDGVAEMARWFTSLVAYVPFAVVSCLDGAHPAGFDAWQRDGDAAARQSPRFGRFASNELLPCAFWPPGTYQPHVVRAPGAPPILVVGSTGDVATPYEQAVEVARHLERGALLTAELDGHIALGDSPCVDAAVTRYLVDLAVPPAGTRCGSGSPGSPGAPGAP